MRTRFVPYGIAASVFLLDRVTKAVIRNQVSPWDTYVVIPGFFNIVHTENRGMAFGFLAHADNEWQSFFLAGLTLLILALLATMLWQPAGKGLAGGSRARLAMSLVMGGALGNLYDRILHGAVTDFLDFYIADHHWPAFNVADSAISIGAGLLILDMLITRQTQERD